MRDVFAAFDRWRERSEIRQLSEQDVISAFDRGTPYVAGETGSLAVFRLGRRLTDWFKDATSAVKAYEHDPERAFDTIEDVIEHVYLPLDELVDICDDYLSRLHCTLWADFDISRPQGRIKAARWLAEIIKAVAKIAEEEPE